MELHAVPEMIPTGYQLVKRIEGIPGFRFRLAFLFDRPADRAGSDRHRLRGGGGVHHGFRLGLAGLLPGDHRNASRIAMRRVRRVVPVMRFKRRLRIEVRPAVVALRVVFHDVLARRGHRLGMRDRRHVHRFLFRAPHVRVRRT